MVFAIALLVLALTAFLGMNQVLGFASFHRTALISVLHVTIRLAFVRVAPLDFYQVQLVYALKQQPVQTTAVFVTPAPATAKTARMDTM